MKGAKPSFDPTGVVGLDVDTAKETLRNHAIDSIEIMLALPMHRGQALPVDDGLPLRVIRVRRVDSVVELTCAYEVADRLGHS